MMKRWTLLVAAAALWIGCGPQSATEKIMLDWGQVLNLHLATGGQTGDYSFPKRLLEIAPELRANLSLEDGWGGRLYYRRIRDDLYHLISAGPDGEFGNDDDVVLQKGAFYPAADIYAKFPFKKE